MAGQEETEKLCSDTKPQQEQPPLKYDCLFEKLGLLTYRLSNRSDGGGGGGGVGWRTGYLLSAAMLLEGRKCYKPVRRISQSRTDEYIQVHRLGRKCEKERICRAGRLY